MAVGAQTASTPDAELPDLKVDQAAHTPGPWAILGPSNRPYADYALVGSDQAGVIAGITAQPEAEANAALIAAAPELLASLKRMEDWVMDIDDEDSRVPIDVRQQAQAAIAMAEGRRR